MTHINPKRWAALALGAAWAALAPACAQTAQAQPAPKAAPAPRGEQAKKRVEAGALLLDVRTPEEFAQGHLPGAVNIPVDALEARLGEVPAKRDVVVYCRTGRRSAKAAELLRTHGHAEVFDLGAMSDWPASP